MSLKALLDEVSAGLAQALSEMGLPDVPYAVEPSRPGFGDVSSNVSFLLAGRLKRSPYQVAADVAGMYRSSGGLVLRVEAHRSGYLNFFADPAELHGLILRGSVKAGYGAIGLGGGAPIVVEHTSVNPNKALHIGHIRNIVIGDVISRVLKGAGYDVRVLNYVDDSGLQVADIVLGFVRLGFAQDPPDGEKFDHYCGGTVYVGTTRMCDEDPSLQEARTGIMRDLENADSDVAKLAGRITRRVLRCQLETCWRLGVYYDCLNFESQILHSGLWQKVFAKLQEGGLVRYEQDGKNAGCWVIPGPDWDMVLVRSNGTATYVAKDIPYAAWKLGLVDDPFHYFPYEAGQPGKTLWQTGLEAGGTPQSFAADRVVTVIDSRQSGLQRIITGLMSRFTSRPDSYLHLAYEPVNLSAATAQQLGAKTGGEKTQMSGRKGLFVDADSVIGLLESRVREETAKRNPGWGPVALDATARDVATGTIRYEMIKQDLDKPITFDLVRSLSLEGDTAPYIQYAHARACRILERAGFGPDFAADFDSLDGQYERDLLRLVGAFPLRMEDAARNLSPKVIARYCHSLAVSFNAFYEHVRVIDPGDGATTNQRLCLVASFRETMRRGLDTLGIPAPDRM